jgi:hypothetical protein
MLKKQVLIGLLLSIIISLAFVSAVNAYSLYDFVSYIQSLFTGGQEAIRGGLTIAASCKDENAGCSSDSECCSQRCKNPPLNPLATYCARAYCKDGCRFNEVCDTDTGGCSGDQLCVRCVGKRQAVDYGCGQGLFERSCDSSVDIGCDERNEGDDCGGGNKCNSEGKCVPSIPTSSANKPCTSDSDCVSSSNDFPKCDNTQDKRTPWNAMCMKCNGVKQAVGSGYNVGACEANCGADSDCDGLDPTNDCGNGRTCDSNCKCLSVSTTSSSTTTSTGTSSTSTTTSTGTATSSSTTTTTQSCPSTAVKTSSNYKNVLCTSKYTCPSISASIGTPVKNSDGTYSVTFTSSKATAVNVFTLYGKIIEIEDGDAEQFAKFDICDSTQSACRPNFISTNYCNLRKGGWLMSGSDLNKDNPARALLPLHLSSTTSTGAATAKIKIEPVTGATTVRVYYLFYYDESTGGLKSWCLNSNKCPDVDCTGVYSGCTGQSANFATETPSVLCAKTSGGTSLVNACWHAPWDSSFPYTDIQLAGVTACSQACTNTGYTYGGTCRVGTACASGENSIGIDGCPTNNLCCCYSSACGQACINSGYTYGGTCRVGTACASGENSIGIDGCPTNNLCCCYYTTPTITPTTQTGTPTTATVTITTTPTTPILPPLPLHCNDCGVGTKCSCELDTTCLEGIWIVKNKDGKPLTVPVVTDIPPIKVEFTPDAKGTVDAIAICFRSDQTLFVRVNKTSAEVKEAMVNCPRQCSVYSECTCTVNFCNSGMFTVFVEDKLLTSTKFKGTFTGKFTPDTVGTAEVRVDCDDPARSSKVQVTITGTTATTTTTPTSEKKFTGTDFKCSSSGDDRTCSLKYTNKYGTVYLSFVFINSDGDVKYITDPSITIGNGSGTKSDTYTCKGSGSLKVRWVAFSKKDKSGPIAWSTTSEEQRVAC